jgi:hypothetical protein
MCRCGEYRLQSDSKESPKEDLQEALATYDVGWKALITTRYIPLSRDRGTFIFINFSSSDSHQLHKTHLFKSFDTPSIV